jgi:hypothetical protein
MKNVSSGFSVFCGLAEKPGGLVDVCHGGLWRGWIFGRFS